jgi:dephospho-CoA kinase
MRIIGLTGGIASGKSTVGRLLAQRGIPVVDADQLARRVVAPGSRALEEIAHRFGPAVIAADGSLDRTALARMVFADPEERKALEAITHPAIAELAETELSALRDAGTPVAVYMAPLLVEAGLTSRVDEVWVVYADRDTQVRRLRERDGATGEEAEARLAAQLPMEEKVRHGRIVIDNRGTLAELEQQLEEILARELKRPAG